MLVFFCPCLPAGPWDNIFWYTIIVNPVTGNKVAHCVLTGSNSAVRPLRCLGPFWCNIMWFGMTQENPWISPRDPCLCGGWMVRTSSQLQNLVEIKMKAQKTISNTSKMTGNPSSSSFLEALNDIQKHTCCSWMQYKKMRALLQVSSWHLQSCHKPPC